MRVYGAVGDRQPYYMQISLPITIIQVERIDGTLPV